MSKESNQEIEESQAVLRKSIAKAEELTKESVELIKRNRAKIKNDKSVD